MADGDYPQQIGKRQRPVHMPQQGHGNEVAGHHRTHKHGTKTFYSSFSVLGMDNYEGYKRHQLATSYRARLLHNMDPRLRIHEGLEALFAPAIKELNLQYI